MSRRRPYAHDGLSSTGPVSQTDIMRQAARDFGDSAHATGDVAGVVSRLPSADEVAAARSLMDVKKVLEMMRQEKSC